MAPKCDVFLVSNRQTNSIRHCTGIRRCAGGIPTYLLPGQADRRDVYAQNLQAVTFPSDIYSHCGVEKEQGELA